jgi:hypothetical protein
MRSFLARISWKKILSVFAVVFVAANLLYLNLQTVLLTNILRSSPKTVEPSPSLKPSTTQTSIEQQIASLSAEVEALKTKEVPASTTIQSTPARSSVKEFYIPLGTGYTTNKDWENVSGAEAWVDTANYPNIVSSVFEASLRIPVANGTVYARLYNVTDDHPVWFSEVSTGLGTSTNLVSPNIALDKGNKLYRVQIKTSLEYPSYLDFARMKIVVR